MRARLELLCGARELRDAAGGRWAVRPESSGSARRRHAQPACPHLRAGRKPL